LASASFRRSAGVAGSNIRPNRIKSNQINLVRIVLPRDSAAAGPCTGAAP
jgi:hypothetical protein